jgi:hypothetical protein
MGQCGSEVRSAEVNQGSGGYGWNELSSKMEPGKDGGALGVLYIGKGGEVRGRGGRAVTGGGFLLPSI